jgi:hypothetical protein
MTEVANGTTTVVANGVDKAALAAAATPAAAVRTLPTPISLEDFDIGVTLGTGSFGRVRFATHRVSFSYWICLLKSYLFNCITEFPNPSLFSSGNIFNMGNQNVEKVRNHSITTGTYVSCCPSASISISSIFIAESGLYPDQLLSCLLSLSLPSHLPGGAYDIGKEHIVTLRPSIHSSIVSNVSR